MFLKTKYYPININTRVILNTPYKREGDLFREFCGTSFFGIKGSRLNDHDCYKKFKIQEGLTIQKKLEIKNFEDWQMEERIAEKKLALQHRDCRPLDVLSTEFADWQTAVETSRFGNDHEFLEICYAGVDRLANRIEVE